LKIWVKRDWDRYTNFYLWFFGKMHRVLKKKNKSCSVLFPKTQNTNTKQQQPFWMKENVRDFDFDCVRENVYNIAVSSLVLSWSTLSTPSQPTMNTLTGRHLRHREQHRQPPSLSSVVSLSFHLSFSPDPLFLVLSLYVSVSFLRLCSSSRLLQLQVKRLGEEKKKQYRIWRFPARNEDDFFMGWSILKMKNCLKKENEELSGQWIWICVWSWFDLCMCLCLKEKTMREGGRRKKKKT